MADLKDKQIRLVGSQNFAYATGSTYTQGHVHFTTDEHGSIVVNGKVYGTTDASYVYVGSENIPTYVANTTANILKRSYDYTDAKINALDGNPLAGDVNGKFVSYVAQKDGNITAYKDTLQTLVTVDNSEAKAYAPKGTNENVKFIKSFEIEGNTIIPKYDYFANNLPDVPNVTVADTNYSGCYLPEFSASGHTITVTNGAQVVSYNEFSEHLEEVEQLHKVVNTFFGDLDNYDTDQLKSYIDTLSEIQEAFKNSYAESIANSIKDLDISQSGNNSNAYLNFTYTTHGGTTKNLQASISYATNITYGLVKYDNYTIVKNSNSQLSLSIIHDTNINHSGESTNSDIVINVGTNGYHKQVIIPTIEYNKYGLITESYNAYLKFGYASGTEMGLVKYDNSTIKMNSTGQLYVNGTLTDTKYSMDASGASNTAQITLIGTDSTRDNIAFRGTGIAKVSYNSSNKVIEINVPETAVNYNHHITNTGSNLGDAIVYSGGSAVASKIISSVSLSSDGKLSFTYINLKHETTNAGGAIAGSSLTKLSSNGSITVPRIEFNACGHITAYENITISGIAAEDHNHDEFVWL